MDSQLWLQRTLGCRMEDEGLLLQALSHRSVGQRNNERLEFFGDSVLGYVVSEALYARFPSADEGQLSRLRVSLVKGTALAALAKEIGLGEHLRLGAGERHGGGRRRDSILADALEAVIGAVALDRGIEVCRSGVLQLLASRLDALTLDTARKDAKTRLQEFLQGRHRPLPVYDQIAAEGEDHQRTFTVMCTLEDDDLKARGQGSSVRAAEQAAAAALLEQLGVS